MKHTYYRVSFLVKKKSTNEIIEEKIIANGLSHLKPARERYHYIINKFSESMTIKGIKPRLTDPDMKYSIAILEIAVYKSFDFGKYAKKVAEKIDRIVEQKYVS